MERSKPRWPGLVAGSVLAGLVCGVAAAAPGSVTGRVTVGPAVQSEKIRFSLYSDLQRKLPEHEDYSPERELANVVVYLEPADERTAPEAGAVPRHHVMEQRDSTFVPHVLPILRGSTVEFPNRDLIFHNVFSFSRAAVFDLGRYAHDTSKEVRFDRSGLIKVFCHIHSDMSAVIMVLPNPWFATPRADGGYRIDGVPAGAYRLVAWHERVRPIAVAIDIEPGSSRQVDFTIPLAESRRAD